MEEHIIKYVAIYLRKSRGDDESALDKHKLVLTELCKENNWKYVLYEEIESGDSIAIRPIFTKLLSDIENGIFDGCCVMDIDRLGRGNQGDQARINQAFSSSNTYIITPQQILNLNNDDDEFIVDMKSFIGRREYKQIVKRLSQGKKIGSRQGNWTNGTPPYGYSYEKYNNKYNPKGLVVNDEQYIIYRMIIDSVINDKMTPKQIAIMLNKMNVPSPRNSVWHPNTILRIMIDETHLGKIITNKTKGDGHIKKRKNLNCNKVENISKDNWVVVENCHEPIKTLEEHEKILLFKNRLTNMPKRTQKKIQPLSGLIKCGVCGHTMGVSTKNNKDILKPCWYTDSFGNKCPNRGMLLENIYMQINKEIKNNRKRLLELLQDLDTNENKLKIEQRIAIINNDLLRKQKSLEKIFDAFENGVYNLQQFKDRKEKIEKNITNLQKEIDMLNIESKQYNKKNLLDMIDKTNFIIDNIQKMSKEDQNKYYKLIIDKIIWTRDKEQASIEIKFYEHT